jgi:hypothetical protein
VHGRSDNPDLQLRAGQAMRKGGAVDGKVTR